MTTDLARKVTVAIHHAEQRSERLVLLVGSNGRGKAAVLEEVAEAAGAPLVNVNLELSRRLLHLTSSQRPRQVRRLLEAVLAELDSKVVLLDRLELLFDTALRQNPFRLLKDLSRQWTVVAAWSGATHGNHLRYAEPGHPEYRHYPIDDVQIVNVEPAAG
ncbi:MAG: BREX-3 system P-loop-containing protein BrxF [Acidobacteriota bacterium]|nr:BREX-3 system P-loop-containing protein BrxF [Acidobacteriota bacterium]